MQVNEKGEIIPQSQAEAILFDAGVVASLLPASRGDTEIALAIIQEEYGELQYPEKK
jgi:hypothetical protein